MLHIHWLGDVIFQFSCSIRGFEILIHIMASGVLLFIMVYYDETTTFTLMMIIMLMLVQACSLSSDNLLLAGTVIRNTKHVFACCVYAGERSGAMKQFYVDEFVLAGTQTKISLNSKITKNKFSTLERSLNKYLVFMVVILLTEMVVSTILSFSLDYEFRRGTDTYLFSLSRCSSAL